jgi:microcystin-dependent protein
LKFASARIPLAVEHAYVGARKKRFALPSLPGNRAERSQAARGKTLLDGQGLQENDWGKNERNRKVASLS